MPEDAVLDAPIETTQVDTESTQVDHEAIPADPAPDTQPDPLADPDAPAEPQPLINGKRISEAGAAALKEIQAKDPELAKALVRALHQNEGWKQAAPGGFKEVQDLKSTIKDLGGPEGIQTLRQSAQELQTVDKLLETGDASIMDRIPPEQFDRLASAAYVKMSETNPEAFTAMVSSTFWNHAYSNNVPIDLARLGDFTQDNPQAKAIVDKLQGFFSNIQQWASKPVVGAKKAEPAAAPDKSAEELKTLKENITRKEWGEQYQRSHRQILDTELSRILGNRKLTDIQKASIDELYASRMDKLIKNDPQFTKNIDNYFKAGDREGAIRHVTQFYKSKVPKLVGDVVNVFLPGKPGPAPAANGAPKKPDMPAVPGVARLDKQPSSNDIDWSQTSREMLAAGQAILQGGKKVRWQVNAA